MQKKVGPDNKSIMYKSVCHLLLIKQKTEENPVGTSFFITIY